MSEFKYLNRLSDCHAVFKDKMGLFLKTALAEGIRLDVVSGTRLFKDQDAIYAQGRTKPGKIVTNAKGGLSWHNYHVAADVCPFNGKDFIWESPDWDKIGEIGKKCGLEWGGDWKTPDRPHFQMTNGLSIREALRTYNQSGLAGVWIRIFG